MTLSSALDAAITALHGPWLYPTVAVLAAAESAMMIGLVVPGETALILGGVAVGLGQANLVGLLTAAIVGAIVGDQVGFTTGRYLGRRWRRGRSPAGEQRWLRAEALIAKHGGPAVFGARWIGLLRAVVPAVAGATGMSRRVFAGWNVLGGALWASAVVLLGVVAGRSWPAVQQWFGTVSAAAGVLGAAAVVIVWFHRRRRSTTTTRSVGTHDGHIGDHDPC